MNKMERVMMICVGCIGWSFPKSILVSTDKDYTKRLDVIAKEAFEKYKATQQNKDVYLVTYNYLGDIEILTQ